MSTFGTLLALANAPAGSGSIINDALELAKWTGQHFLEWVEKPGNLSKVIKIVTEAVSGDREQAVKDLVACFTE